jgi:signal transduction histidine kinase
MRLLNRTLLSFLIYSVLVLLIVTPLFYWVVNTIIIREVDETLLIQKKEIQARIEKIKPGNDLSTWEDLDGEVVIKPFQVTPHADSIYTKTQFNSFSREMEPYRVLKAGIIIHQQPYQLVARISLVESEDLIKAVVATQLIVLLILLTGMVTINWWISRRIWQPFYDTLEELKKFEIEKAPNIQLATSSVKEFEDLNRAILQLTARDRHVYLSQKEFTENAAHEMQTPLAIFQSKLELLLQMNLSEQQAQVMESLMNVTSRLIKLNKALLLLSKIDSRQFSEIETVDIAQLTSSLLSLYEPEAREKKMVLKEDIRNNFTSSFNATLIDILLSNLISNAIRYGSPQSIVQIILEDGLWQIENEGEPLTIDPEKIFERFQKGSAQATSTGLGLAIVKKICDTTGLDIQYDFKSKKHIFTIRFLRHSIQKALI